MTSQDYKLLVLDLDETLVFSTEQELHRSADLRVSGYHVYKRPYLDAFLDYAFANFGVGGLDVIGQALRRTTRRTIDAGSSDRVCVVCSPVQHYP